MLMVDTEAQERSRHLSVPNEELVIIAA